MGKHLATRTAFFDALSVAPAPAPVFSQPQPGQPYPVIVIGQVVFEASMDKTSDDDWYLVAVVSAVRGYSPAVLDTLSDFVIERLATATLSAAGHEFNTPELVQENDEAEPDAPGGPIYTRAQQFRVAVCPTL